MQQRPQLGQHVLPRVPSICRQHLSSRADGLHTAQHRLEAGLLGGRKDMSHHATIARQLRPPPPPRSPGYMDMTASPFPCQRPLDNLPAPPQPPRKEPGYHLPHRTAPHTAISPNFDAALLIACKHPLAPPVPVQPRSATVSTPRRPVPVWCLHLPPVRLPVLDLGSDQRATPLAGRAPQIEVEGRRRRLVAELFCGRWLDDHKTPSPQPPPFRQMSAISHRDRPDGERQPELPGCHPSIDDGPELSG